MTTNDLPPGHRTDRPSSPPVQVRMSGERVVVRVVGGLDHDATDALTATMNAAIDAGQPVTLDLDPHAADQPPTLSAMPDQHQVATCGPQVTSVGAGLIRIPIAAPSWTIDVYRHRLCTNHDRTQLRSDPQQSWIPIRSVTVTDRTVTAVSADSQALSGSAAPSRP